MKNEFIPYEQALELKELGFDEPCFGYFRNKEVVIEFCFNDIILTAPLYQQAFRWFREKHGLYKEIRKASSIVNEFKFVEIYYKDNKDFFIGGHDTYEEAELACLKKLIEIAKTSVSNPY